jgi:cell division protein FtsQ
MQRPTPLPPQAEKPAGTGAADSRADAASGSAPSAPARAASTEPLAPITPIARGDEGGPEGGADDVPAGDAAIGVRDVWRAARARRRALRAEVRRFTGRQRRRRALWIGTAASIVLLVLVTLGAAYSPLFAVEDIRVVGTSQLNAADVASALDSQVGKPLPLVDESAVKAALVRFPLVESYTLEARPPHELVVRIVERTPVGAIQGQAGYTVVDAAGVPLSTTQTAPAGQPIVTVPGVHSDAFASLGQVMRALPAAIRSQVTAASATTADDVTLTLGATRTQVLWGSADQSALKALVLEEAMKAKPPASVAEYDVSTPTSVVFR